MQLEPHLAGLAKEHENVVVKRIDIVSWSSDAFKQINNDYGVRGIPYLRIYGTEGELLGEVSGGNLREIRGLIEPQAKKK